MKEVYMKKWMALLIFLCSMAAGNTVAAQDYVFIEQLIKSHKELSNKLRDRVAVESATLASHYLLEEADKKYEGVTDTLSNRMSSSLTDASLLADVARLTNDAIQAYNASERTYEKAFDLILKYPFIQEQMAELNLGVADRLVEIYRIAAMVATNGLKVSLGTPQQRYAFLTTIDERICWIAQNMNRFYAYLTAVEMHWAGGSYMDPNRSAEAIYNRIKRQIDRMSEEFSK